MSSNNATSSAPIGSNTFSACLASTNQDAAIQRSSGNIIFVDTPRSRLSSLMVKISVFWGDIFNVDLRPKLGMASAGQEKAAVNEFRKHLVKLGLPDNNNLIAVDSLKITVKELAAVFEKVSKMDIKPMDNKAIAAEFLPTEKDPHPRGYDRIINNLGLASSIAANHDFQMVYQEIVSSIINSQAQNKPRTASQCEDKIMKFAKLLQSAAGNDKSAAILANIAVGPLTAGLDVGFKGTDSTRVAGLDLSAPENHAAKTNNAFVVDSVRYLCKLMSESIPTLKGEKIPKDQFDNFCILVQTNYLHLLHQQDPLLATATSRGLCPHMNNSIIGLAYDSMKREKSLLSALGLIGKASNQFLSSLPEDNPTP